MENKKRWHWTDHYSEYRTGDKKFHFSRCKMSNYIDIDVAQSYKGLTLWTVRVFHRPDKSDWKTIANFWDATIEAETLLGAKRKVPAVVRRMLHETVQNFQETYAGYEASIFGYKDSDKKSR